MGRLLVVGRIRRGLGELEKSDNTQYVLVLSAKALRSGELIATRMTCEQNYKCSFEDN